MSGAASGSGVVDLSERFVPMGSADSPSFVWFMAELTSAMASTYTLNTAGWFLSTSNGVSTTNTPEHEPALLEGVGGRNGLKALPISSAGGTRRDTDGAAGGSIALAVPDHYEDLSGAIAA
jgi:hypothetical protein